MSVFDGLRRFDAFSKPQEDFRTKTVVGGLISIFTIGTISLCLVLEWISYFRPSWRSEIQIDTLLQDQIPLHFDIVFPRLPCLVLNLDRSEANSHKINNLINFDEKVRAERVSSDGKVFHEYIISRNTTECKPCAGAQGECCRCCADHILSLLKNGKEIPELHTIEECKNEGWPDTYEESMKEGCHIQGEMLVSRLSGEFHFSLGKSFDLNGTHVHDISLFKGQAFDFSHKIVNIAFGDVNSKSSNPLQGATVDFKQDENVTYSYYLKLVPFQLKYSHDKASKGFHLSATRHQRKNMGESALPLVVFNYEFSAMSLVQTQSRRPFSSFITGLFAIIGGIYTLSALLDSCIFSVERSLKAKDIYGKSY